MMNERFETLMMSVRFSDMKQTQLGVLSRVVRSERVNLPPEMMWFNFRDKLDRIHWGVSDTTIGI